MSVTKEDRKDLYKLKLKGGKEVQYFYRVVKVKDADFNPEPYRKKQTEWHPAYQVHCIGIQNDRIVDEKWVGKPDVLDQIMNDAVELIDPQNGPERLQRGLA